MSRTLSQELDILRHGALARCYVLGALDPTYADPAERDAWVRRMAPHSPTHAAEFLRGWAEHHETIPEPLTWHRWIGGVAVEVAA